MNILEMLTKPGFSIELFSTVIADKSVFAVVVEHMRLQLSVLNKFFTANITLVVSSSRVSSNMPKV